MILQNQSIDLTDISPSWLYKNIPYNKISPVCNVLTWQGSVKNGGENVSEHAISICVAIPNSCPMLGPIFLSTYVVNLADYLVRAKVFTSISINGDAMEIIDGENKYAINFGFRKFMNGISFEYIGLPNYADNGKGIGFGKDEIEKFQKYAEDLAFGMSQSAFVNGVMASI